MREEYPTTGHSCACHSDARPSCAGNSARRPALLDVLRGRLANFTPWAAGLLGLASLSLLSNGGQIGPCPCCGSLACPNAAAAQGLLGGAAALGMQLWSRLWGRKKP